MPAPAAELQMLVETGQRIFAQQRRDKRTIYSMHAPHTECIAKGKARKR